MKKIIEYIKNHKKSFICGLVVVVIIVGFICCSIKPKALAFEIDYQDFNYVCGVSNTEQSGSDLLVDLEVIAYISNNKLVYDIDSIGSARLVNGDEREILVDKVYLIKYDSQGGIIQRYVLFDDFIAGSNSSYYQQGYEIGNQNDNAESYSAGYNAGWYSGIKSVEINANETINQLESEIERKNEEITNLTEALQNEERGFTWGSFTKMLGNMVLFPINWFKEGLNIDLWGINVGALCTGIILVGSAFGLIALIWGRKK